MDFTPEKIKGFTKWFIAVATVCIVVFLSLYNLSSVIGFISEIISIIAPLLIGFAFALVLNVPMRFFEFKLFPKAKKQILISLRRPLAFIISLVIIFGIIIGIVYLILPELSHAFQVISQSVVDVAKGLSTMNEDEIRALPLGPWLLKMDWNKWLDSAQSWLKEQSGEIINTAFDTIGSLIGGIYNFFVAFVFAAYILFGKEKLKKQATRIIEIWIPNKIGKWFIHAFAVASRNLRNFISGQFIEAVIIGLLCFIGMAVFGFPYALMTSVLVGVTALIPIVGAFIGAIFGCFMILTIAPIQAVLFLVFLIILQQIEGNLIYPKVMGSRVNLPGLWILASVTIGGTLAGPVGMLLSVPVAATIYQLFRESTLKRELVQTGNIIIAKDAKTVKVIPAGNNDTIQNSESYNNK